MAPLELFPIITLASSPIAIALLDVFSTDACLPIAIEDSWAEELPIPIAIELLSESLRYDAIAPVL